MLQKLLDLLKLQSFRPHQEIAIQSIIQDQKDAMICNHIDYHNQHESAELIGLFLATSSMLTSVESYRNHRKPTQGGVQGSAAESNLNTVRIDKNQLLTLKAAISLILVIFTSLYSAGKMFFSCMKNRRFLSEIKDRRFLSEIKADDAFEPNLSKI